MPAATEEFTPEFTNLVKLIRTAIDRYGDRKLFGVRKEHGWEWTSYREFGVLVDQFRGGLASLGIGHGDRVAVISNNRLEWVVSAHAVYSLGGAYVPMYEAQLDKEWEYIRGDSGWKAFLVANAGIEKRVRQFARNLPALSHIINFEGPLNDDSSY